MDNVKIKHLKQIYLWKGGVTLSTIKKKKSEGAVHSLPIEKWNDAF